MTQQETDKRFMEEALKEARQAFEDDEVPVGAVVECRGRVIARGRNMNESLHDPTAHAEMIALTAATEYLGGKYLKDCTLYVTMEPCPMCAAALAWAQVDAIVFGASDPKRGYRLFSPSLLHPKTQVRQGVMEQECSEIVVNYFKTKR